MRCRLGLILVANFALAFEQGCFGRGMHLLHVCVLLVSGYVSLSASSGRDHCEPNHALVGPFFLQSLHIAAVVMFFREWTPVVVPFQNNKLALVVGKFVRLPVTVGAGEVWRLVTNLDCERGDGEQSQNGED